MSSLHRYSTPRRRRSGFLPGQSRRKVFSILSLLSLSFLNINPFDVPLRILATVQIGAKVYGFGNKDGLLADLQQGETSPKKQHLSPKKTPLSPKKIPRLASDYDEGIKREEKASLDLDDENGLTKKPKNLLGTPEQPPQLTLKRNRRRLKEEEEAAASTTRASPPPPSSSSQQRAPPLSITSELNSEKLPNPATRRQNSGTSSDSFLQESSPGTRRPKKQKSDPNYSITDLINNI